MYYVVPELETAESENSSQGRSEGRREHSQTILKESKQTTAQSKSQQISPEDTFRRQAAERDPESVLCGITMVGHSPVANPGAALSGEPNTTLSDININKRPIQAQSNELEGQPLLS